MLTLNVKTSCTFTTHFGQSEPSWKRNVWLSDSIATKSLHSGAMEQCWVAHGWEIKCFKGCDPDMNPTLYQKKKKESLLSRLIQWRQTMRILRVCSKWQILALKGEEKHGSRKSKWCSMLFPWGGVMQMRQASRFVPLSQKNFGAIYADVEQNGWSDLVICESSKGERNESLDAATRPCMLPAFWMTSWLFIPLDSRPLLFFFLFVCSCTFYLLCHIFPLYIYSNPVFFILYLSLLSLSFI